jgi:hypothetical protein
LNTPTVFAPAEFIQLFDTGNQSEIGTGHTTIPALPVRFQ